jgi:5-methylcytosine-specific restriction endonuclease McrA
MSPLFSYPLRIHHRRHKPRSYRNYSRYRDFLRDEFVFRCVYCLTRETWLPDSIFMEAEHFVPKSLEPEKTNAYSNLLYACRVCNSIKSDTPFPDKLHPETNPWGNHLVVGEDGIVTNLTPVGEWIISTLTLNTPGRTVWRRKFLRLFELSEHSPEIRRDYFGFPANMPNFVQRQGAFEPYSERCALGDFY